MSLRWHNAPPLPSLRGPLIAPIVHSLNSFDRISKFSVVRSHLDPNDSRKLVLDVKEKLEKDHYSLPVGKYGRDDEDMILWFLKDVLMVEASKRFPGMQESSEDEKLSVFLIEKALSRLQEGKDEILTIVDLQGFGTKNADLKFVTFLFDVFYYYYPKRLGQILFVEAPFVFKPVWQLIKPLLKSYASLVRFCSVETVRKEYFTQETVAASFRD